LTDESTELVPVREGGKLVKVSQHEAIRKAELYVTKNLPRYLKKLEELARGVTIMKPSKRGEPTVYTTPPDRQALEYLIDRGMGKPPQRFEFTGEGGGPVGITPWATIPKDDSDIIDVKAKVIEEDADEATTS